MVHGIGLCHAGQVGKAAVGTLHCFCVVSAPVIEESQERIRIGFVSACQQGSKWFQTRSGPIIETTLAKMRIFRVPEFLATAFLLAVIGMLVHLLLTRT